MKIIITGGCGFIGVNVALEHLKNNDSVILIDNLSRKGTELNLKTLKSLNKKFIFYKVDIRNFAQLRKIIKLHKDAALIYHFAAQVAVTTSVINPRDDSEINITGTFNVLESMRICNCKALLIFSSTNKVYGGMENARIILKNNRYQYKDHINGIDENFLLDFHSPYGCSKGAADQYVRDYHRIYGLNTVVFRQSCIYGQNQFGVEDQGWVAYFTICALLNKPITIYGDGKQVRDILYIDDLMNAFTLAYKYRNKITGEIFNIGGGKKNQISILESIRLLEKKINKKIDIKFSDWRPGDQKIYVSNNKKLSTMLNWQSKTNIDSGISELVEWVENNKSILESVVKK